MCKNASESGFAVFDTFFSDGTDCNFSELDGFILKLLFDLFALRPFGEG